MTGRLLSANNNAATFITEQRLADEATLVWSRESDTHADKIMAFIVLRDESKDNVKNGADIGTSSLQNYMPALNDWSDNAILWAVMKFQNAVKHNAKKAVIWHLK